MTFLLSCAVRGSIILAAGLMIAAFLKGRSAALRHFVLTVSLLASAVVPLFMLMMPVRPLALWNLSEEDAPTVATPVATTISETVPATPSADPARLMPPQNDTAQTPLSASTEAPPAIDATSDTNTPAVTASPFAAPETGIPIPVPDTTATTTTTAWRIKPIAAAIWTWLGGVLFSLAGLLGGVLYLRRILKRSVHLSDDTPIGRITAEIAARYGLGRRVELFECSSGSILATWGVLRPKLLLPAGAQQWPEERIRIVIHHELAHIRRRDWWIQVFAELHRIVYWFNPLYWVLCRRLVRESEQACDDVALTQGIKGSDYAVHLLELTRMLKTPRRIWSAALSMARETALEHRFSAILNPNTDRHGVRGVAVLTTLAIFAGFVLPLTAFRAVSRLPITPAVEEIQEELIGPPELEISPEATSLMAAATPTPEVEMQAGRAPSIRGKVMLFGSNDPAPAANVELRRIECGEGGMPAEVYTALTNLPNPYWTQGAGPLISPQILKTTARDDGSFAFENLTAGSYCIVAFRGGGYLAAEYRQRSYRGPGSTIVLSEGQQLSGINLALVPTGSISGRVTDARGEPIAHAQVQALEPVMYEGRRRMNIAVSLQTNDLGEFRLYWLPPGRYYVAATIEDPDRRTIRCCTFPSGRLGREELMTYPVMKFRELEDGAILEETYTYVYYGSGTDPGKALPVDVKPGLNTAGVDIPLTAGKQRSWRVRGTVTNGITGQPAPNVSLRLMPREWIPNPIVPSAYSDASGAFDIAGVVPGSYYLYATGRNAGERGFVVRPGAGDPIPVPELMARTPVTVSAADLNGVNVTIAGGLNLAGRVAIEGLSAAESAALLSQIRVRPLRDPDIFGQPAALTREPVPSGADGAFTLTGIGPGDYRVFVEPLIIPPRIVPPPPPPAPLQSVFVKAIRLGNLDVLSQGLHINGPVEGQLEVVIGKAGEVRGRVIDAKQQPVINVTVAAIPDASLRSRPDLYKRTRTDAAGVFRLYGVAPGEYKLFAWEQVEEGVWLDADFLRPVESRGRTVRVTEGRTENVDVTVISR